MVDWHLVFCLSQSWYKNLSLTLWHSVEKESAMRAEAGVVKKDIFETFERQDKIKIVHCSFPLLQNEIKLGHFEKLLQLFPTAIYSSSFSWFLQRCFLARLSLASSSSSPSLAAASSSSSSETSSPASSPSRRTSSPTLTICLSPWQCFALFRWENSFHYDTMKFVLSFICPLPADI